MSISNHLSSQTQGCLCTRTTPPSVFALRFNRLFNPSPSVVLHHRQASSLPVALRLPPAVALILFCLSAAKLALSLVIERLEKSVGYPCTVLQG